MCLYKNILTVCGDLSGRNSIKMINTAKLNLQSVNQKCFDVKQLNRFINK